jgi:hypothetical protein
MCTLWHRVHLKIHKTAQESMERGSQTCMKRRVEWATPPAHSTSPLPLSPTAPALPLLLTHLSSVPLWPQLGVSYPSAAPGYILLPAHDSQYRPLQASRMDAGCLRAPSTSPIGDAGNTGGTVVRGGYYGLTEEERELWASRVRDLTADLQLACVAALSVYACPLGKNWMCENCMCALSTPCTVPTLS